MTSACQSRRIVITAMVCSAAIAAGFVGGKATRDALLLTFLPITALPTVLIAAAVSSLLLVAAQARWGAKIAPAVLVPAAFVVSGVLFLCEFFFRLKAPMPTAVIVYLHVSGAGPLPATQRDVVSQTTSDSAGSRLTARFSRWPERARGRRCVLR